MDNKTGNIIEQDTQKQQGQPELAAGKGGSAAPKKKLSIALIAAVAIVLVAVMIGVGIYNTPANQLSRQLDLGYRYLESEQYEEAIVAFERAIAIDDRCLEAYTGAIEGYLGAGNQEATEEFYDRTLAVLAEADEEFIEENMDQAVEIYIAADDIYEEAPEKAAQILEEGLAQTEDQKIRNHLIKDYQEVAKDKTASDEIEEALVIYDRLLELDAANTETVNDLSDCLNKYINRLMEDGQYDRIRELALKYGDIAENVDFASTLARIQELEKVEAENRAFMQMVYDLMAAEDYEGMYEIDGSEEADAFVERMESERYLYFPDDNASLSGTGAGVYTFGEGGYYFYYGEIENGERKGTGTEFLKQEEGYCIFTGEWDKDAPNGLGVEILVGGKNERGDNRYNKKNQGLLVNGLWNGFVEATLTDLRNGEDFDLSFSAEDGIPTRDRTEEYLNEVWFGGRPEEGEYIYAYDYHRNTGYAWWSSIGEEEKLGIDGFTE